MHLWILLAFRIFPGEFYPFCFINNLQDFNHSPPSPNIRLPFTTSCCPQGSVFVFVVKCDSCWRALSILAFYLVIVLFWLCVKPLSMLLNWYRMRIMIYWLARQSLNKRSLLAQNGMNTLGVKLGFGGICDILAKLCQNWASFFLSLAGNGTTRCSQLAMVYSPWPVRHGQLASGQLVAGQFDNSI